MDSVEALSCCLLFFKPWSNRARNVPPRHIRATWRPETMQVFGGNESAYRAVTPKPMVGGHDLQSNFNGYRAIRVLCHHSGVTCSTF